MILVQHYLSLHAEGLTRIAQAPQTSHWNGRIVAYITGYLLTVPLIGSIVWIAMRFFASLEQPIPVQISTTPPSVSLLFPIIEQTNPVINQGGKKVTRCASEAKQQQAGCHLFTTLVNKTPVSPPSPPLPTHEPIPKAALDTISEHSDEDTSSDSTDHDATNQESQHNSPILGDPLPVITQDDFLSLDVAAEPLKKTPRLENKVEVAHDLPKSDRPEPLQEPPQLNGVAAIVVPPPPAPAQVLSYTETTQEVSFHFTMEIQKKADEFIVTKTRDKELRTSHYDLEWNIVELHENSGREWWKCKKTDKGIAFEGLKQKKTITDAKACKRWLQEFHVGFQPFAKSKDKEMHFSILSEKDLSFANLVATKTGYEKINGKDALKLEIRLDNWALKHFWSGLVWIDLTTGFMVRKKMKDGVAAPITVTNLTTYDY